MKSRDIITILIFVSLIFFVIASVVQANNIKNLREINDLQCKLINQHIDLNIGLIEYSNDLVDFINVIDGNLSLTPLESRLRRLDC